jgi:hypothetical protein
MHEAKIETTDTGRYIADARAARYGAAAAVETDSAREACARRPPIERTPSPWPLR